MKLSEQLKEDHQSGDFGQGLEGYSDRAETLELELQPAHEWLDDRGVPRSKGDEDYTILSRMQILYSCEVD